MKESFWGYWLIVLGIFVIIIMMLISNVTTNNTQDYYMIKDVTEAAMVDAIDYSYYRQYQELRINREKFVENFLRRFAENVSLNTYTIDFYDIYEAPPKVSVKVTTKSGTYSVMGDSTSFDIVNKVDSILETSGSSTSESTPNNSSITSNGNVIVKGSVNHSTSGSSSGGRLPSYDASVGKVPAKEHIDTFLVNRQSEYYDCVQTECVLKEKYRNNNNLLMDDLIKAWEEEYDVTFSQPERQEFIDSYNNKSLGDYTYEYDSDSNSNFVGSDYDYDDDDDDFDDDDDESKIDPFDTKGIQEQLKRFVRNNMDEFYYDYGDSCHKLSLHDFESHWLALYDNYNGNLNHLEEEAIRNEMASVYNSLPNTTRVKDDGTCIYSSR